MTGVKHGIYDLDRLIKMLAIDETGDQLIVTEEGIYPVEKYLMARFHMFRQVYQHKTVIAAESVLISLLNRAATLAKNGKLETPSKDSFFGRILRAESISEISIRDYLDFDDHTLWFTMKVWAEGSDTILSDLSRRLLTRKLFKLKTLTGDQTEIENRLNNVREFLVKENIDPDYYLINYQSKDTPYKPYDPTDNNPTTSIFVKEENAPEGYIEIIQRSEIIRSLMKENYSITQIVYPASVNGKRVREKIEELLLN